MFGLVFLLTVTHGSFNCKVDIDGDVEKCEDKGITQFTSSICKGKSFVIHIDTSQEEIIILCPWSPAAIVVQILGTMSALTYTVSSILQRKQRSVLPGKVLLIVGLVSLGILLLSAVLMLSDAITGLVDCQDFESSLGDKASQTDCSIGIFGMTLVFLGLSLAFLAYEIFVGYHKYKRTETEELTEGVYYSTADFQK